MKFISTRFDADETYGKGDDDSHALVCTQLLENPSSKTKATVLRYCAQSNIKEQVIGLLFHSRHVTNVYGYGKIGHASLAKKQLQTRLKKLLLLLLMMMTFFFLESGHH